MEAVHFGDGTEQNRPTPVRVGDLTGIIAIAAGNAHSAALDSQGRVWAWGANWLNQVGNGTNWSQHLPAPVLGATGMVAIAAAPSGDTTFALRADGTVWATAPPATA